MFKLTENSSSIDDIVIVATDENLTTENWEYILHVCDQVNADPENGAKNVINSLTKRLKKKYANTQIYALSLLLSLSSNCGSKIQQAIACKSFVKVLMELAYDDSVHRIVKSKLIETLEQLSIDYRKDPSLRQIEDALNDLRRERPDLCPLQKPEKHIISEAEKALEEEELQMVLALSLSELESGAKSFTQEQSQSQKASSSSTPAPVSRVKALYDFNATEPGELSFKKGDIITVLEPVYCEWWRGFLHGQTGIFPLNYVHQIADPTPEEIEKDVQEELIVFSQRPNIEKLLTLLSNKDATGLDIAENEELQTLYHSTLAIRPKLVKLIDKYAQRKDQLLELNEKFLQARKIYDDLMESSIVQYRNYNPSITSDSSSQQQFSYTTHQYNTVSPSNLCSTNLEINPATDYIHSQSVYALQNSRQEPFNVNLSASKPDVQPNSVYSTASVPSSSFYN